MLIEARHLEVGAEPHRAGIGRQRAGEQVDERGLAAAVGPDDADAVAAQDARGEIRHDRLRAERLGDRLGLYHERARRLCRRCLDHGLARPLAKIAPGLPKALQRRHAPHVALATRGDAVAHPVLLAHDLAVELVLGLLLLGQLLVAPGLEPAEAELDAAGAAAIEPHGDAREVLQEASVVADQHQRAAAPGELPLQPLDRRQIEMVGGLVEQEDVGLRRQHARERRPPQLAAREIGRVLGAVEAELLQQVARLVRIVGGPEARLHISERVGKAREVGLLRQIADRRARLHEALALVGLDQPRRDPQQGRFARAVAPDQAHTLARGYRQPCAFQQRRAPEGQSDVGELEERRSVGHRLRMGGDGTAL